jgi:hypothetical protein
MNYAALTAISDTTKYITDLKELNNTLNVKETVKALLTFEGLKAKGDKASLIRALTVLVWNEQALKEQLSYDENTMTSNLSRINALASESGKTGKPLDGDHSKLVAKIQKYQAFTTMLETHETMLRELKNGIYGPIEGNVASRYPEKYEGFLLPPDATNIGGRKRCKTSKMRNARRRRNVRRARRTRKVSRI